MKITAFELYHVSVPLKTPFWPSWIPGYPQTHNNFTLIKIMTDEGITGYSAGPAQRRERAGLGDILSNFLIDADPTNILLMQSYLKQISFYGWRNFWIEPACWDIIGKMEGKPVYEILGGKPHPVDVYLSTGEMHEPKQRIAELLHMKEHGFKTAKLRIKNVTLQEDIKHLEIICKGVGDKLTLGVDVNQGWLVAAARKIPAWDLNRAMEFSNACYQNGIKWLEEPLDSRDYDANAALKRSSQVKISGAELNYGWDEIKIMLEKDCFDIYQPDATLAGGIFQSMQVIKECEKRGRIFSPHTWTNGIGFYINWNLKLVAPPSDFPLEYPLEEPSWIPEKREGIIEPIIPDAEGRLQPFTRPGLGFEINEKLLKKYGQRFAKYNKFSLAVKLVKEKGVRLAMKLKEEKEKLHKQEAADKRHHNDIFD
jgi:D-galactarolactone cycloisomerase